MTDQPDQLLRGIAAEAPYRVAVARTSHTVREAVERHGVRGEVAEAFARGITGLALAGVMDKDSYRLSAQWMGRGLLGTLNVDLRTAGTLRAFSTGERDAPGLQLGEAVGGGLLSLVRQKEGGQFSQGQVTLASQDIDGDLEAYLDRSDQVPTVLRVMTAAWEDGVPGSVVGVMVQAMPGASRGGLAGLVSEDLLSRRIAPGPLEQMGEAAAPGLGAIEWLERTPLSWSCGCSAERVRAGVRLLGAEDLADMIAKGEEPEVRCDYCTAVHVVDTATLRELLAEAIA